MTTWTEIPFEGLAGNLDFGALRSALRSSSAEEAGYLTAKGHPVV